MSGLQIKPTPAPIILDLEWGRGHKLQFNQKSLKLISPKYLCNIDGSEGLLQSGRKILWNNNSFKEERNFWDRFWFFFIIRNIKANESRNAHVIHVSDSFLLQIDTFRPFQQMESGRETGNVDDSILNFEYYRNRQILLFSVMGVEIHLSSKKFT